MSTSVIFHCLGYNFEKKSYKIIIQDTYRFVKKKTHHKHCGGNLLTHTLPYHTINMFIKRNKLICFPAVCFIILF